MTVPPNARAVALELRELASHVEKHAAQLDSFEIFDCGSEIEISITFDKPAPKRKAKTKP